MKAVEIHQNVARRFVRLSKKRFPIETFAILLGRRTETKLVVSDLFIPTDLDKFTTEEVVFGNPEWPKLAKIKAQEEGLLILGDIHSHCFKEQIDCVPSEFDWDHSQDILKITEGKMATMGILTIWRKPPEKYKSRLRFWPIISPIETKIK